MVSRVVIYLLIMCLLKLCWCVEQPSSSLLEKHPLFAWLCKNFRIYKAARMNIGLSFLWSSVLMWMGSYGGDCSLDLS